MTPPLPQILSGRNSANLYIRCQRIAYKCVARCPITRPTYRFERQGDIGTKPSNCPSLTDREDSVKLTQS